MNNPIINTYINPEVVKNIKDIENKIGEEMSNDEIDRKKIAELRKAQIYQGFGLSINPNMIHRQIF